MKKIVCKKLAESIHSIATDFFYFPIILLINIFLMSRYSQRNWLGGFESVYLNHF